MDPENEATTVTAIEPVQVPQEPIVLVDVDLFLEQSAKRAVMMERIMEFALKYSTENDWVLQRSGNTVVPYLQATGCEKIARLFGVKISSVVREVYRRPDGHFTWEFWGVASLSMSPGDSIEVFGSRESMDPFFSRSRGEDIPPEDISEADVKKAGYSNFFVNAVSRLLGLRGFTVEQLEQAGLDPSRMRGVEYKGAPGGASSGYQPAAPRGSDDQAPSDVREKLFALMNQIVGNNKDMLAEFLEKITGFEGKEGWVNGVRTFRGMRDKRMGVTLDRLRKAVESSEYQIQYTEKGGPIESDS